jgi:hypothetical protein
MQVGFFAESPGAGSRQIDHFSALPRVPLGKSTTFSALPRDALGKWTKIFFFLFFHPISTEKII